jgi:putative phosphoesterase
MRIAIVSDIHDHITNIRGALKKLYVCDELICCGDLCSPFIVKELGLGFTGPIHIVFGNNDGDRYRIYDGSMKYPHIRIHGEVLEPTLGGKRFGVNHFDNLGRSMALSGKYDVVCFGHNHEFEVSRVGHTLVVNPGEIFGMLTGDATCVVYDTDNDEAIRIDV